MWFFLLIALIGIGIVSTIATLGLIAEDGVSFKAIVFSVVCVTLVMFPLNVFKNNPPNSEDYVSAEYKLHAMQDNMTTTAKAGLLYVRMDEDLNYWIRRDTERGQKVFKLDNDDVYFEETNGQPKMEVYSRRATKNQWLHGEGSWFEYYKLYVPEGSLTNRFNGDMEYGDEHEIQTITTS